MSNTTVEEIEIIVTAKVEEALREFNKMKPQLMKVMEEVSKEISKVDFKELNKTVKVGTNEVKKQLKSTFDPETLDPSFLKATEKLYEESIKKTQKYVRDVQNEMSKGDMQEIGKQVAQATEQVKQALNSESVQKVVKDSVKAIEQVKDKLEEVKETNKDNEIKLDISNEEALEQITQLEKEIEALQKKIREKELKLNLAQEASDKIKYAKQDEIRQNNPNIKSTQVSNRADFELSSDSSYTALVNQADKLNIEVTKYSSLLESAKNKLNELKKNTSQVATEQEKTNTKTSKLQAILNSVGVGIKGAFNGINSMLSGLGKIFKAGGKVVTVFKKFTPHLGNGMKSLLKYAATLFSLKSVYNTLNSAGQAWLSSQDSGAKQLSANIDYMKYALGSAVAPVIQYVTNLFYQLLKAVQSVIYALFKVNIFAKAGASAYNSMANSANKASKANKGLSSIHSEINNVSSNSGDSSGSSTSTPSFDLSSLDTQLTPLQQRLADFFRPLVESWNTYSPQLMSKAQETFSQIGLLLESIGKSFVKIFANGTVYTILENILSIIGNIAEAFANAWNYNGNGDAIVQNLADSLNNLLIIINMITESAIFQWLLDIGVSAIKLATDAIEKLSEAVLWVSEKIGEFVGYFTGENSDKVDGWSIILGSLASAILLVVGAVTAWDIISKIAAASTTIFGVAMQILTSPITLIVLAIAAVIAIVASLIIYWDEVKEAASKAIEAIKEFISNGTDKIKEIFTNIINWIKDNWQSLLLLIVNPFAGAFKLLYDNCEGFRNFIDGFVEKIKNFFKDLWTNIQNILSNIGNFFSNIFHSIGNTVSNVFNGIWNTIKGVINCILGGIESMANGIVWGVNKVIDVLNNINIHIPDWIPVFGGKDIGFHINQMSTVSLPRLAKGGILTSATAVMAAEYPGAKQNPEIFTPENLLYNTQVKALKDVFSDGEFNSNAPIYMTVMVGNKKIGQIAIEDIRDKKRATGGDLEVIFS